MLEQRVQVGREGVMVFTVGWLERPSRGGRS
jgi:hypothetical protein